MPGFPTSAEVSDARTYRCAARDLARVRRCRRGGQGPGVAVGARRRAVRRHGSGRLDEAGRASPLMAAAAAPATPSDLRAGSWWAALKRTVRAVPENNVMDTGRRP